MLLTDDVYAKFKVGLLFNLFDTSKVMKKEGRK